MLFRLATLATLFLVARAEVDIASNEWCPTGGCWEVPKSAGQCGDRCPRICGNPQCDLFVVAQSEDFCSAEELCAKFGGVLANIDNANFNQATETAFKCSGPNSETWVRSFDQDSHNNTCLVLSTGSAAPGGSINVPTSCHKRLYTMCSRRQPKTFHPCEKSECQRRRSSSDCNEKGCPCPLLFEYRGDNLPGVGPRCQFSYVTIEGRRLNDGEVSVYHDQLVIRPEWTFDEDDHRGPPGPPKMAAEMEHRGHRNSDDGLYLLIANDEQKVPHKGSLRYSLDLKNLNDHHHRRRSSHNITVLAAEAMGKADGPHPPPPNPFFDLIHGFFIYGITDPDSGLTVVVLVANKRIYVIDDGFLDCRKEHGGKMDWVIPMAMAKKETEETSDAPNLFDWLDGGDWEHHRGIDIDPISDTPHGHFNLAFLVDSRNKSIRILVDDCEVYAICGHRSRCRDHFPEDFKLFFGLFSKKPEHHGPPKAVLQPPPPPHHDDDPFIPAVSNVNVWCCDKPRERDCRRDHHHRKDSCCCNCRTGLECGCREKPGCGCCNKPGCGCKEHHRGSDSRGSHSYGL